MESDPAWGELALAHPSEERAPMFWKKGQPPPSTQHTIGSSRAPTHNSEPPVEVLDIEPCRPSKDDFSIEALETLAEVLRAMGRHAFDLDEVTRTMPRRISKSGRSVYSSGKSIRRMRAHPVHGMLGGSSGTGAE